MYFYLLNLATLDTYEEVREVVVTVKIKKMKDSDPKRRGKKDKIYLKKEHATGKLV